MMSRLLLTIAMFAFMAITFYLAIYDIVKNTFTFENSFVITILLTIIVGVVSEKK